MTEKRNCRFLALLGMTEGKAGLKEKKRRPFHEEPPSRNKFLTLRHMNFMNFSLASSISSAETVVAPRSLANRSISFRAMG